MKHRTVDICLNTLLLWGGLGGGSAVLASPHLQSGWPVPVSGYYGLHPTPAVADLDNDGGLEIATCAMSTWTGTAYAFMADDN